MKSITDTCTVYRETKGKLPSLPFVKFKNAILGADYNLTVVFVGAKKSQHLNNTYRNKNYPTNILSFGYDKKNGELYIHLAKVRTDAKLFHLSYQKFLLKLYIHGLLHLKGLDHSSTMDHEEERFFKQALLHL